MRRPLFTLAWLNLVLHGVGLLFAVFGMRPGTNAVSVEERLEYLKGAPAGWSIGWVTWMFCAAALIAFLATAVNRLPPTAVRARLGLTFSVVGLGFDLFCDATYILVLPKLAAGYPPNLFLTVERLTGIGSLLIGNGGYSLGTLLIAFDMSREGRARPATTLVGIGVGVFGLLLAACAFPNEPLLIALATGPTIVLFCVWVLLVARDLEHPA